MKTRLLLAAALLLPAALTTSPAHAALPPGNILQNGDAEAGPGATNATDHPAVPGWETIPNYTAVAYGTPEFPSSVFSTSIGGGRNFFAGGPDNGFSDITIAQQTVDLSPYAADLDQANVQATLSADLGGYATQDDSATVTALFTDSAGQTYNGGASLEPATREDRDNETKLIRRTSCVTLTPGARELYVQVAMQRTHPSYIDGYADNISVTLSNAACPAAPDAPLPPPAPPQAGVSANADVVSGRVLVKRPGSTEFQELRAERSIPVGAEVDVSKGTVALETAATSGGKTQTARFYQGSFIFGQTRGSRPITDLTLTGGRIDKCPNAGNATTAASRSRRLWGNGRGRFRTRGRYATATVRGTVWSVQDTCSATRVRVSRGSVLVRDLSKRRNVTLKAPKSYTARAPRR